MALLNAPGNYFTGSLICITLKNGYEWAFTDFSNSIDYNSVTYEPIKCNRSSITRSIELVSQQVQLIFEDATEEVIPQITIKKCFRLGLFDYAKVEIVRFFYKDSSNITYTKLFRGYITEPTEVEDGVLTLSIQSYVYLFNQEFPREIYTLLCNNRFKDSRCGYSVADLLKSVEYQTKNLAKLWYTSTEDADDLIGGYIEFYTPDDFTLHTKKMLIFDAYAYAGDLYLQFAENFPKSFDFENVYVRRGCDKTQETCTSLDNIDNFRGFPKIPRPEVML